MPASLLPSAFGGRLDGASLGLPFGLAAPGAEATGFSHFKDGGGVGTMDGISDGTCVGDVVGGTVQSVIPP